MPNERFQSKAFFGRFNADPPQSVDERIIASQDTLIEALRGYSLRLQNTTLFDAEQVEDCLVQYHNMLCRDLTI